MQITGLSAYKEGVEDLLADVVKKSPFKSGNDPEYRVGYDWKQRLDMNALVWL